MRILIVGSGGREHAIAWKIVQSPLVEKVYVAPGNDGIKRHAETVPLSTHDEILQFVSQQNIDLTFIGQEIYLVEGLVDKLESSGHKAVGPSAKAAALEGSKSFAKDFMHNHAIPTSAYGTFQTSEAAIDYLHTLQPPYVIKASGLAAGKGVVISQTLEEAIQAVQQMLSGEAFGNAGETVVIEEFLKGEEASYFVLTDGINFIPFPSCQDHKRIGELDTGLNTGGMGAYSPAPIVTLEVEEKIIERIVKPTIQGMATEGYPYKGVIYIGLMIHEGEPKVIEYNCRFGDPECQPLMMRLKSDLLPLLLSIADQTLAHQTPKWHTAAAACVMLASQGYPASYHKGKIISGLPTPDEEHSSCVIFHSGTKLNGSVYQTNGGRVLGVTTLGDNLESALQAAYRVIGQIFWDGMTFRRDIGLKGLKYYRDNRPELSVGLVIESKKDLEIVHQITHILEQFNIGYRVAITSVYHSTERIRKFLRVSEDMGIEIFIVIGGVATNLSRIVASGTIKPVIGVPVASETTGFDPFLSILQKPSEVSVAMTTPNSAVDAAFLATQILALRYSDLRAHLHLHKLKMEHQVAASHEEAGLEAI